MPTTKQVRVTCKTKKSFEIELAHVQANQADYPRWWADVPTRTIGWEMPIEASN